MSTATVWACANRGCDAEGQPQSAGGVCAVCGLPTFAPDCPPWCDGTEHATHLRCIDVFRHSTDVARVPLPAPVRPNGEIVAYIVQEGDAGAPVGPPTVRVLVDLCEDFEELDFTEPRVLDELAGLFQRAAVELRGVLGAQ